MKRIVVVAAPRVRTLCPPDMLEGRWLDVEQAPKRIAVETPPGAPAMVAVPNGRWMRNDVGETAMVYELDLLE